MTATLSADDRAVHDRDNRCRSIETIAPPTSAARIDQPIPSPSSSTKAPPRTASTRPPRTALPSFIDAAVDGIQARDRRPVADQCPLELLVCPSRRSLLEHARPSIGSTPTKETKTDRPTRRP